MLTCSMYEVCCTTQASSITCTGPMDNELNTKLFAFETFMLTRNALVVEKLMLFGCPTATQAGSVKARCL
eukprot:6188591-Pleurochrysis_carterae.AAC.1